MSVRFPGCSNNAWPDPKRSRRPWAVLAFAAALMGQAAPVVVPTDTVLPGIDVWRARRYAPLAGLRVGLVTNSTGISASGESTIDILQRAPALQLTAILSPEHGLQARIEGDVSDTRVRGLPVYSLYGDTRRPTPEMLQHVDALVVDLQDIGTRFYTYATTMAYCMEAAASRQLPVVILDRPNPISGNHVSGPVLQEQLRSFVGYASIPTRHGLTLGELARYFNTELEIGADLHVVPMHGWQRSMWFDQTGLLWKNPSPNIRNLTEATLYPAIGPLEHTNISVGRGTDTPFEWLGAPWIDSQTLAAVLNAGDLPGLRFVPRARTPRESIYAGESCGGVDILLLDRERFAAGMVSATLATSLARLYPTRWQRDALPRLWGTTTILEQLDRRKDAAAIVSAWQLRLQQFLERRSRYLLYP